MRGDAVSSSERAGVGETRNGSPGSDPRQSKAMESRVYKNAGNASVVDLIRPDCRRVLDVGCGAGDNAALIRQRMPDCEIFGITRSEAEAESAREHMKECWVADLEGGVPEPVRSMTFDCIVFSHVLEHLLRPAAVVAQMAERLPSGGRVVIAVPNVMYFKVRMQFLRGKFEYQPDGGILDDTHLHFYTYFTASEYLLSESPDLRLVRIGVPGHFPLFGMRGRLIPRAWGDALDLWAGETWPNLFGPQIALSAEKL